MLPPLYTYVHMHLYVRQIVHSIYMSVYIRGYNVYIRPFSVDCACCHMVSHKKGHILDGSSCKQKLKRWHLIYENIISCIGCILYVIESIYYNNMHANCEWLCVMQVH